MCVCMRVGILCGLHMGTVSGRDYLFPVVWRPRRFAIWEKDQTLFAHGGRFTKK